MISLELNQSICSPRSSISWNEPMAIASNEKPSRSNGRGVSLALFLTRIMRPIAHRMPTGRLM